MLDLSKKVEKDQIEWYRNSRPNFMIGHHEHNLQLETHSVFNYLWVASFLVFSRPLEFLERIRMHELAEGTLHPFECAQSWLIMVQLSQVPWPFFVPLSSFQVHRILVFWHSATKPDTSKGQSDGAAPWGFWGWHYELNCDYLLVPKTALKLGIQLRCCCSIHPLLFLLNFMIFSTPFCLKLPYRMS